MDFSIIIPCYNEEKNIDNLIVEIDSFLKPYKYELVIVDDKSTDNTLKVLEKYRKDPKFKILKNNKNFGQSYSLFIGIKEASNKTIITMDGDGQNNPKDIPNLYKIYNNNINVSLVSGIRIKRKDKVIKIISSRIANYIRGKIFNDNCKDTGCSLKVFDKEIFMHFPFFDGIHRFIPSLFSGLNQKIIYVDVDHRFRKYGISKYGTIDRLFRGLRDMIIVYRILKKMKKKI